ncbi:MAG: hypothetical protein QXE49_02015 [Nitrososphaerota archaeon]
MRGSSRYSLFKPIAGRSFSGSRELSGWKTCMFLLEVVLLRSFPREL